MSESCQRTHARLARLLAAGRISRREFVAGSLAIGGAATLPQLLSTADALADTPKRGGTLRAGLSGASSTDTLDPTNPACCGTNLSSINYQIRNTLVETDAGYRPSPGLAESWEATDGPSKWTFRLRHGVEFHNGKTFGAQDAMFSLNAHRGDDNPSPASVLLKQVKELTAPDDHTLVFELDAPSADFPAILADYHLQIAPDGTADWNDGVGTGPFRLVRHEPGVRSSAVRNPNYWRDGMPYFDAVECLFINDVVARTNGLVTGELDVIDKPDLQTIDRLEQNPNVQVVRVGSTRHYTLPMHADTAPYDNPDLRLALKYALPRDEILSKVSRGYGSIGNDQPISPLQRYYVELPQRAFDLDRARHHFERSGVGATPIKLYTAEVAFPGAVETALLFQSAAAQAGIDIEVVRASNDGYWSDVWRKQPFCMSYWTGRPTEDWMFSSGYESTAPWNDANWKHERFDRLLHEARSELDDAKRRELYGEMQRIVHEEGAQLIPMFGDTLLAAAKSVRFATPLVGNFELDGFRAYERWWFA